MKRQLFAIMILMIFLLAGGLLVTPAQAQEEEKWFDLSDFNPLGHRLDSIEEAVPGLRLKGIIWNDTGLFLNGRGREGGGDIMRGIPTPPPPGSYNSNPGLPVGAIRKRNYNLEKIEWFTELEARYMPPSIPNLEFVSIWDFRYNALYDWDHSFKHSFGATTSPARRNLYPAVKEADEYYNDTKRIWRELYLKWTPPGWVIQLGKQQHIWAKVDTKIHDAVFPVDLRYGTAVNPRSNQLDFEYVNIPTWMLSVTRQFTPNLYFQLIWNFDYERNYTYPAGYVWPTGSPSDIGINPPPLTTRMRADMPTWNIKDHEWITRLGFTIGRWNGHLFYAYVWDKSLTGFRRAFRIVGGLPHYWVEPKPTRLHYAGIALDTNFWFLRRQWTMFFENYFLLNKYLPNLNESVIALGLTNPLLNKYDGYSKRTMYQHAWGVESYFLKDFSFLVYWLNISVLGRDGGIPAPQPASPKGYLNGFFAPALTWRPPQFEDRFFIQWINMIVPFERLSAKELFSTGYSFSNYLSATVTFHTFWGEPVNAIWGPLNDRHYVEFKVRYEF